MLRADADDALAESRHLQDGTDDVEAESGRAHAATDVRREHVRGILRSSLAGGNVLDPSLQLRLELEAIRFTHGTVKHFVVHQAVRLDQPLMPREVVDHVVDAAVHAGHRVQKRHVLDLGGSLLGERPARRGRRVGSAKLRPRLLGLVGSIGALRGDRVVLDRVVAARQPNLLAVRGANGERHGRDPLRLATVQPAFLRADQRTE